MITSPKMDVSKRSRLEPYNICMVDEAKVREKLFRADRSARNSINAVEETIIRKLPTQLFCTSEINYRKFV